MAGKFEYKNHKRAHMPTTTRIGLYDGFSSTRMRWIRRLKLFAFFGLTLPCIWACDEGGSPINTEITDQLSMPKTPKWKSEDFQSAKTCQGCHPRHYEEWSTSMHAYATKDPVWRALVTRLQIEKDGKADRLCAQCHSPIGTRAGEFDPNFKFENLSPIANEGVTCEGCHKVTRIVRTLNAGHEIDPNAPMRGPIMQPGTGSAHLSSGDALFDTSEFCAGCHDVMAPNGLMLEEAYGEWQHSPAAVAGQNCQSCHMPTYFDKASPVGDVPDRELHSHRFVGVSTPLSPEFSPNSDKRKEIEDEALSMLRESAELTLSTPPTLPIGSIIPLEIMVKNKVLGHSLPTGSTFNRQLWLEIIAYDAVGNLIFHTGGLDANDDLTDANDPHLTRFNAQLIDKKGNMTMFPWEAVHVNNLALKAGQMRSTMLMIPTHGVIGPVTIKATLNFRQFPPYMLRELGLDHLLPELHVLEVAGAQTQVALEEPS